MDHSQTLASLWTPLAATYWSLAKILAIPSNSLAPTLTDGMAYFLQSLTEESFRFLLYPEAALEEGVTDF